MKMSRVEWECRKCGSSFHVQQKRLWHYSHFYIWCPHCHWNDTKNRYFHPEKEKWWFRPFAVLAMYLGVNYGTIMNWANRGWISAFQMGDDLYVDVELARALPLYYQDLWQCVDPLYRDKNYRSTLARFNAHEHRIKTYLREIRNNNNDLMLPFQQEYDRRKLQIEQVHDANQKMREQRYAARRDKAPIRLRKISKASEIAGFFFAAQLLILTQQSQQHEHNSADID